MLRACKDMLRGRLQSVDVTLQPERHALVSLRAADRMACSMLVSWLPETDVNFDFVRFSKTNSHVQSTVSPVAQDDIQRRELSSSRRSTRAQAHVCVGGDNALPLF